ncbi:hypothetical protein ACH5RR_031812 [Cinchona calisaya]|uniref:Methyltransferase type 11 domain-containing protein n=1 Tax=Cinchona calisaya TaxID=153742 RepID=A0ABD2YJR1_9GENT
MGKNKDQKKQEELLKTLGDFTSKENWDQFFTIRGSDDSFEWYAEWPQLKDILLPHLSSPPSSTATSSRGTAEEIQILVPGCGNSKLSEYLYYEGFRNITNVDFSKVVILDMLRRNVRLRPEMKWRVMDMTHMQFEKESFDVVLDKGGLDALMEPELGPKLGNQYLSEVKRVLKDGGKFVCLTLAESHVLGLLFPKFRCGWKMSIHAIPQKSTERSSLLTFMVIAEKDNSTSFSLISSSHDLIAKNGNQACGLYEVLESENKIRSKYSSGSDVLYSLEDLKIGANGNLAELNPGRRVQLTLGEPGGSRFTYKTVLLDAPTNSGPFSYHCGVFLVPKTRAHEWLYSSEEGQWVVVDNSKAARLVMILLDSSHSDVSMDDIQKDLSPLIKQLEPGDCSNGAQIPFMAASDGIKQRNIVHQVSSSLTGPIIVEDVIYEKNDDYISRLFPSKDVIFRRLIFERSKALIQSEALLTRVGSQEVGELGQKKTRLTTKHKRKGNHKRSEPNNDLRVDHNYLASSYHSGIISGFILVSSYLGTVASKGDTVKAVVIGLGAGLLPMFLHGCLPFLEIEVVELDSVVLDVARDYFDLKEDIHLKVHVSDGIKYVREIANSELANVVTATPENEDVLLKEKSSDSSQSYAPLAERKSLNKIDLLIVDVDSSDSSSGLTCPAADFIEESFLLTARNSLSEQGLFVINLVSRSPTIKDLVFSRMKTVFANLFYLQLEEDLNVVIFALNTEAYFEYDRLPQSCNELARLLKLEKEGLRDQIIDDASKIKRLR